MTRTITKTSAFEILRKEGSDERTKVVEKEIEKIEENERTSYKVKVTKYADQTFDKA